MLVSLTATISFLSIYLSVSLYLNISVTAEQNLKDLEKKLPLKIYYDFEYTVHIRNRYIPTAWDDITATSIYQNDHH